MLHLLVEPKGQTKREILAIFFGNCFYVVKGTRDIHPTTTLDCSADDDPGGNIVTANPNDGEFPAPVIEKNDRPLFHFFVKMGIVNKHAIF